MDTFYQEPEMFRDALVLTRQQTGFAERLIEKDYFCTALLEYFAAASNELVFKGGTCLAKVHANFYRLSEDLDFVIPMLEDAPRSRRSRKVAPLKEAIAMLPEQLTFFQVLKPLTGANNSTQYLAQIGYVSPAAGIQESVKIEIGLREPLLLPASKGMAKTILLDPISGRPLLEPLSLSCISKIEAFAEKFRAALSRREVAVRDFFDLDYAVRKLGLRVDDVELMGLVRQKLAVRGNEPVDVSDRRLAELRRQVESQLRPVLRREDFAVFDVDRVFRLVADMADRTH
jgi:predicted nucleotidyltransferase component of viral defense system